MRSATVSPRSKWKPSSSLQLLPARYLPVPSLRNRLVNVFYDYANKSAMVSGMYYLRQHQTNGFARLLWILIPIMVLAFGAYLAVCLFNSYEQVPTLITVDKPVPIQAVVFPAITFCHPQTVIDYKARLFVQKIKLPDGTDENEMLNALPAIGMFVENPWGSQPDRNELSLIDETLRLNNLTVRDAVKDLGLICEDFIKVCAWAKVEFPCFQSESQHLSITSTTSHIGMCCSFNYHPDNHTYKAYQAGSFGTRGGLSIIGSGYPQVADGKSGALFSSGFIMLLHHPYDYPVEGNPAVLIGAGTITSVAIYPTLYYSSADIQSMSIASRRCILDDEWAESSVYRQPACAIGCTRKFVYEQCKCHPFHYPRAKGNVLRDCTAIDAACYAKMYLSIKRTRCKYCLPSCTDIRYVSRSYANVYNLRNSTFNITPMYRHINVTELQFTVHVYMASHVAVVQKQILTMSSISLLANLGGVFNLCLGISILSAIELLFYVCIKIPQQIKEHYNEKSSVEVVQPHHQ